MSIEPIALYPPHPSTVRAQATSLTYDKVNGRVAYAMGRSIFVRPVDPHSAVKSFQFSKHTAPTTVAAFAPNGNYIASGDESGHVKIWDTSVYGDKDVLKEAPLVKSDFPILSGAIKSIAWDADNSRVIAVGEGKEKFGHCFTWDSGNSIGEIQGHSDVINTVDIKAQRPYRAATAGNDKAVVFYTGPPFKFDKSIRDHHTNTVRAVKFSPDGKYLLSVGSDRLVVVYDGKTGEFVTKIENAHEGGIFGVWWFGDSKKFATCSADNSVKVWSVESWESTQTLKVGDAVTVENQLVGLVVTDKYIIALSLNGNLNYFDVDDGSLQVVQGHQSAITATLVVGHSLVTGGSDGSIYKWTIDGDSLKSVPQFVGGHSNYVVDLAYDKNLISVGWDDKLKVWDLDNGTSVSETVLVAQPKKLVKQNGSVSVLFENSLTDFTITESIQKGTDTVLKYDSSDVDVLAEKLLLTNLSDNKIESASLKFDVIRGSPSLVRVSPDEQYVALGDSTGKYIIYNADASIKTTRWTYHTSKIVDAKWSPDSQFLLSGGLDSNLLVYSIKRISKVVQAPLAHQSGISRVEWLHYDFEGSGHGVVASTGFDGAVKVWKVDLSVFK